MKTKLQELKTRLQEISHLSNAIKLSMWDQRIYMPAGGCASRGRQIATLTNIQ